MTVARARFLLALLALVLGAFAALARTPYSPHAVKAARSPIYKPASGC